MTLAACSGQTRDRVRTLELVVRQVQVDEVGDAAQRGRDAPNKGIVGQVESGQVDRIAEGAGDGASQLIVVQRHLAQL
jgi:hypothetical protein